jgi:hypothetical protein
LSTLVQNQNNRLNTLTAFQAVVEEALHALRVANTEGNAQIWGICIAHHSRVQDTAYSASDTHAM